MKVKVMNLKSSDANEFESDSWNLFSAKSSVCSFCPSPPFQIYFASKLYILSHNWLAISTQLTNKDIVSMYLHIEVIHLHFNPVLKHWVRSISAYLYGGHLDHDDDLNKWILRTPTFANYSIECLCLNFDIDVLLSMKTNDILLYLCSFLHIQNQPSFRLWEYTACCTDFGRWSSLVQSF